jgi:threonine 3-dehydrogenase
MPEIDAQSVFKTDAARGALVLRPMTLGDPRGSEVLIAIHSASICGTDLHLYKWNEWARKSYTPPFPMGHEFGGTVTAIGPEVAHIRIGDRVTAETHLACGHCHQCRINRRHTCENLKLFSRMGLGCFSSHTIVPEAMLRRLPDDVPMDLATLMEPFGIAVRAVSEASVSGADLLILGAGPIGLLCVVAARALGANRIFVTDLSDYRQRLASSLGADEAGAPELVEAMTVRADAVIDTTGSAAAVSSALEVLHRGGRLIFASLPEQPLSIDVTRHVVLREIAIGGVYGRRLDETWIAAERLMSRHAETLRQVVTHRLPLADYRAAFALAESGQAGKVVLCPDVRN